MSFRTAGATIAAVAGLSWGSALAQEEPSQFVRSEIRKPPTGRTKGPLSEEAKAALARLCTPPEACRRLIPPLQMPSDTTWVERASLIADETAYTASFDLRGATLSVHGTSIVARLPEGSILRQKGKVPERVVNVERTESGFDAGFEEFGASYLVSLECIKRSDARCSTPDFLRGVTKSMVVYELP